MQLLLLIFIFVVLGAALAGVFWAGSVWFQGYIYSEPAEGLQWRAPAAAVALTLFYVAWAALVWLYPGRFDTLQNFSPEETQVFDKLWARRAGDKNWVEYSRRGDERGRNTYLDKQGKPPPGNTEAVKVKDGDAEAVFQAETDAQGNLLRHEGKYLIFRDDRGREMSEGNLGLLTHSRWLLVVANIALNLAHFVVWFVCVWLLLHFQWHHAFGLAFIFWMLMTVAIVPMVLNRAELASPRTSALAGPAGTWLAALRSFQAAPRS